MKIFFLFRGLIDEQKLRFRRIAEAAATKVEQNR